MWKQPRSNEYRVYHRHCERSEAIPCCQELDCFVASLLAMTNDDFGHSIPSQSRAIRYRAFPSPPAKFRRTLLQERGDALLEILRRAGLPLGLEFKVELVFE